VFIVLVNNAEKDG